MSIQHPSGGNVGTYSPRSSALFLAPAAETTIRGAMRHSGNAEACGLLFGTGGHIAEASVAPNISDRPCERFEIDPAHLFEAARRSRAGPHRLLGCWHSHPGGGRAPSVLDRQGVSDESWLWLIATAEAIDAWRPVAGGFEPVALIRGDL